jgi:diaphanous 1
MASALESELRTLFLYYGESTETIEGMKAEDFFGMILSFSTSLQVSVNQTGAPNTILTPPQKSALEVYKAQGKQEAAAPKVIVSETPALAAKEDTTKPTHAPTTNGLAPPQQGEGTVTPTARSHGRAGGNTIQRGDFDQAIRGMLDGTQRRRRENQHRPLSRIFVDGSRQSRAIE